MASALLVKKRGWSVLWVRVKLKTILLMERNAGGGVIKTRTKDRNQAVFESVKGNEWIKTLTLQSRCLGFDPLACYSEHHSAVVTSVKPILCEGKVRGRKTSFAFIPLLLPPSLPPSLSSLSSVSLLRPSPPSLSVPLLRPSPPALPPFLSPSLYLSPSLSLPSLSLHPPFSLPYTFSRLHHSRAHPIVRCLRMCTNRRHVVPIHYHFKNQSSCQDRYPIQSEHYQ